MLYASLFGVIMLGYLVNTLFNKVAALEDELFDLASATKANVTAAKQHQAATEAAIRSNNAYVEARLDGMLVTPPTAPVKRPSPKQVSKK